ncbi:helix-turn-helix transcriptional regulator [Pelagibacterium lacus]|uniref:Helix-turn-helix transcriptional regulator n=2 Tax=Pelagibacterium lacus TaxID=2282655 RepID=A0A369W237_9HYPH|nr:helix-turn-helix transcriptional regulator [Pelagibacterium lacus]
MPVYAAAMGGEGHIIVTFDEIDRVKRPAELENVKGGYGLLIKGDSMVPAFDEGDMALVNPHLPPARDKNVILYHTPPDGAEAEAMVKRLLNWTDKEWTLRQYNPPMDFKEFRQEWPVCHRVVGRYDGR